VKDFIEASSFKDDYIFFCFDKNDLIFITHNAIPYFRKYTEDGKLLAIISYEIPMDSPKAFFDKMKPGFVDVKGAIKNRVFGGITVDSDRGLTFIAAAKRPFKKDEMVAIGSTSCTRYPKVIKTDKTDIYRLLVFNEKGKVISSKDLQVFCDKLYYHNDYLFIIDYLMGMKIYEYKVSFK